MSESVKFTFKKKSQKPVLLNKAQKEDNDTEYISNTSAITRVNKKKKKLVIPNAGNLWQPGSGVQVDDITKEAIAQILSDPKSVSLEKTKQIGVPKNTSVVPQEESTLEDYNDVPVTDFGEALMRGMGWEKGKGVGRNRKFVEPIDFDTKKKTLGVTVHEEEAAEADRLFHEFNLGEYVEIVGGHDKGKHAKILSLSLETSRSIVRLPNDEMVDLAIINMKKGSREEYLRQRDQSQETVQDFKVPEAKRHKPNGVNNEHGWLHQDLRVRVVSQEFLDGKYYCHKVDVVDIIDPFSCVCRTQSGKLLENVPQSILETVIPKKKGSIVMLLSKSNRFELAELEEKNSKSESVICVTLIEKDVVTASFDEVCQYIGDAAAVM